MGKHAITMTIVGLAAIALSMGAMMSTQENDGRIDYVEFWAKDLERTKTFYRTVFRWKFTDYGPDYTSFDDGRLSGGFRRGDAPAGGPLVVIYAVDLDAMQAEIEHAGGTIVEPIFSFPGGRRFHFHDPNGNELAVWSEE